MTFISQENKRNFPRWKVSNREDYVKSIFRKLKVLFSGWWDWSISLALSDSARLCRMKLKSMNKKPPGVGAGGRNTARSDWGNATYNDLIFCFLDQVRWHYILDLKQRRGFHLQMPLSQSNQTAGYLRTSYTNPFSPGLEFSIKSK